MCQTACNGIKKTRLVSQDYCLDRICTLQRYLTLIRTYFPSAIPLIEDEIKGTCLHTQPIIFQNDFTKPRMSYDECDVHELLEYFNNNQENMPRPTGPPFTLRVCSNPRHQKTIIGYRATCLNHYPTFVPV